MTSSETELISILDASGQGPDGGTIPKPSAKSLPEVLPILGLSDIVFFPGMVAPLLVDTQQSIRLIDDVVGGDRFLGLFLQHKAETENPVLDDLHKVGCAARVLKMLKFPDNTVRVLVEGLRRIEVEAVESSEPYLKAKVKTLKDEELESVELTALTRHAHQQFQEIINLSPSMSDQVKIAVLNTEKPSKLADLIAANINISLLERQDILATPQVEARFKKLSPLLSRELEVLSIGSKIQKEVAESMSKSQRDYFLREQIRVIQKELGETDPNQIELDNLKKQIEDNNLPEEPKKIALKELDRLRSIPPAAAEYTVARNYVDWIVSLPWNKSTQDQIDLPTARKLLDEGHYGLDKVKERLLEYLAVIKLKHSLKGPILCLAGPPGVGKTSLGRSVADALGRKFIRISLGGMRDEAEIRGHRRTYVGALPGRILQALRRVESNNPVILLDEIDKVGSDFRGDPASALLEVLDPQQNTTFTDHYLDIPFDLSKILFITTANWLDPIHPALKDRMELIELPSYTLSEKLQIARRHLVPRQLEEHGVKPKLVKIPDTTLTRLIQDYTREAGLRQLEREVAAIIRKAARKYAEEQVKHPPLVIKPTDLKEYLGMAKFHQETAENITECGIATGLAWTPVGGSILFIEATKMPGKGTLMLTGSLGDVMKESAQTALSYLRSQAHNLGIDLSNFDISDIHIHVPAGATPKDGPSAGITMAMALASLFTGKRIRSDVAMTGEISLRGRVLPVGGIKEKVLAASRSRIKELILSEQNENDWLEVPEEVRERMKVHFVRHISEALPFALRSK